MNRRTAPRLLLALAVSLSLTACGGDAEEAAPSAEEPAAGQSTTQACETRPATAEPPPSVTTDQTLAPEVPASDAPPPCELVVSDVLVGVGAEAADGSTVAVKYVGAFYETGEEFDSSWSRGTEETLPVTLGAGQVIPGFEQGITGMREGGRRMITIPSDLAYGDQGRGPIPGGATLVFVLDLVQVG
ncbi:FKBP-type peptidyl-prolyl cis-trans isomerase [Modestobacter marinus]|uniref:FKBP-type peptidyl-prolyl cis-trans isomerase n=1 Tax=Modestobacter marinus TaxID=477641 RepID=UPI001C9545D2|nr:FKBP-type peptidyl-prolyl cis-trans isomerase [Modestobacter marinus]